jgi:hypothetical protein
MTSSLSVLVITSYEQKSLNWKQSFGKVGASQTNFPESDFALWLFVVVIYHQSFRNFGVDKILQAMCRCTCLESLKVCSQ